MTFISYEFYSFNSRKPLQIVGWTTALIKDLIVEYESFEEFPSHPAQSFQPSWSVTLKVSK